MPWTVELGTRARKELKRLPALHRARIGAALDEMRRDPLSGDVAKLKGQNAFRRRVGNYRIVLDIAFKPQVVRVFAVLRRTTTTYR